MKKFLFIYWKHPIEPLGIMYLSAALKKAGHNAKIVIVDMEDYKQVLSDYKPDVVCGSILTGGQQYFEDLIKDMKTTGHKFLTIMGGIHPTFHPQEIEKSEVIDIIITGEAEEAIVDFANALEKGESYSNIPNIWAKIDGKIYKNDKRPLVENLDLLEDADREIVMEHEIWRNEPIRHFIIGRGCPFKCTYCLLSDNYIHTNKGVMAIKDIVESTDDFKVMTGNGTWRNVVQKHKRYYNGTIVKILPFKMNEEIKCTNNHRLFVFREGRIQETDAAELKETDKLCIPIVGDAKKNYIDILEELKDVKLNLIFARKVPYSKIEETIRIYEQEKLSTRKIATRVGLSKSYVHQIVSDYEDNGMPSVHKQISIELENNGGGKVRFSLGKIEIPRKIKLNHEFMRLVGYYLAEGSALIAKNRPNSAEVVLSFGKHEQGYIQDVCSLSKKIFNIEPKIVKDKTATRVVIYSNILGLLFSNLFGKGAKNKQIPSYFLGLSEHLLVELLRGYIRGDGDKNLYCATVSRSLAYQLFMISYKLGMTPGLYKYKTKESIFNGRVIKGNTDYFVVTYGSSRRRDFLREAVYDEQICVEYAPNKYESLDNHILLPIRKIEQEQYNGFVYNLGIEENHTYTVNNIAVYNCFNHAMIKNYGADKGNWVRFRSVERVIDEIKRVIDKYGGKMVYFQDDTFTVNKPWIEKFTKLYKEEVGMPYHCHIRADHVDEKMAKMLAESGCYSVHMAIEAGNDHIRINILKRGMSREQIFTATKLLNKYGIKMMLQNMVGLPTGTVEDDLETLKINIMCKPLYAWCSIFQPYPGIELTEFAGKQGLLEGDYEDISPKFFNNTVLKMEPKQKKEIEYLHKWFAVAANYPILYYSGAIKLLMKAPDKKFVKKTYGWVYQKYRENRDNELYGIQIWKKNNKIQMVN